MMQAVVLVGLLVTQAPADPIAVMGQLTVSVPNTEAAALALITKAQEHGGYFSQRTDTNIVLKVPRLHFEALQQHAVSLGKVLTQTYRAEDLAQQLREHETRLASRDEVLRRYDEVIKQASLEAVVAVEREMTNLVQQMEATRGTLRVLQHRAAFAELHVSFALTNRQAPVSRTHSSFRWLNSVSLSNLYGDFNQ